MLSLAGTAPKPIDFPLQGRNPCTIQGNENEDMRAPEKGWEKHGGV
jgi:hypothetical protein